MDEELTFKKPREVGIEQAATLGVGTLVRSKRSKKSFVDDGRRRVWVFPEASTLHSPSLELERLRMNGSSSWVVLVVLDSTLSR